MFSSPSQLRSLYDVFEPIGSPTTKPTAAPTTATFTREKLVKKTVVETEMSLDVTQDQFENDRAPFTKALAEKLDVEEASLDIQVKSGAPEEVLLQVGGGLQVTLLDECRSYAFCVQVEITITLDEQEDYVNGVDVTSNKEALAAANHARMMDLQAPQPER